MLSRLTYLFIFLMAIFSADCQELWHGKERVVHYRPEGKDFVKVHGKLRFNRALYGTNTGFRVEAGDLPEFALYMPGMGGNLKFGLIAGDQSKWLIDADSITTIYRPGSMIYEIKDALLGKGILQITVLALDTAEGMIISTQFAGVNSKVDLCWAFGGASGKKFSRDGDIGADPESSFYLQADNCKGNQFQFLANSFVLQYGGSKKIAGVLPANSTTGIASAKQQSTPAALFGSTADSTPVMTGRLTIANNNFYFLLQAADKTPDYSKLSQLFNNAEGARKKLAERVTVTTPDPWINTLGGALSVAADAIWESPTYLHGAVAWRMRLPAWRGPYVADVLGWHDRARTHFSSYALSQVTEPEIAPVIMDTALHLARHIEKMGTALFSSGYICRNPNGDIRPHHYDMNLVYVDQLLNHFNWTGDLEYVKKMWPVLERHIEWEKRNFDADGDGLYDAYCCIWASDALQYSGGGVAHSSAYNYRANRSMAELARLIGKDPTPYQQEADKIFKALNNELWNDYVGVYAEYKDLMGLKQTHDEPGLWTIYHLLDAQVPDPFRAWQSLRYVDDEIPHIPVRVKGLPDKDLFLLSTTDWQPYTWSVNNVALAENLHTALAYWQGNRPEEAFHLWKSALLESMYVSSSPGGFEQLSFYDAIRGELYRDFADPIGMAGRSLVEGLFGIKPDLLHDTLTIQPGFPGDWNYAAIKTPDITIDFKRTENIDQYIIESSFAKPLHLQLLLKAVKAGQSTIEVNGNTLPLKPVMLPMGYPLVEINGGKAKKYIVRIDWKGDATEVLHCDSLYAAADTWELVSKKAVIKKLLDPQGSLQNEKISDTAYKARLSSFGNNISVFVKLKQGAFEWWQPLSFKKVSQVDIDAMGDDYADTMKVRLTNQTARAISGQLRVNAAMLDADLRLNSHQVLVVMVPSRFCAPGLNRVQFDFADRYAVRVHVPYRNATVLSSASFEKVNISALFNDKVNNIFKRQYLSPRPSSPTLQLPVQGIGNWCYPLTEANIDDAGLRRAAGTKNEIVLPQGIPFATPGDSSANNIAFTSLWDNYPDTLLIPLSGKASHAYMLMAGSTNPMQSHFRNGELIFHYKDGSIDFIPLINPGNWVPIEQDYYEDGYAFTGSWYKPYRYYLKKGVASTSWNEYTTIRGYTNRAIDGGAATILDFPLYSDRELESLELRTEANDVVIGLMSLTLLRVK